MSSVRAVLDEIKDICTKLKNVLEGIEKPLEIINETDEALVVVLRTIKLSRDTILLMEFIPVVGEIVMPIEAVLVEVTFPLNRAKITVHKVNNKMKKVNEKLEKIGERIDAVLDVVDRLEDAGDTLRQLKKLHDTIVAMKNDSGDLGNTHPFIESLKVSIGTNGSAYSTVQDKYDECEKKEPKHGWFRHAYWRFKEIQDMKSAMEGVMVQTNMKDEHNKTKKLAKGHDSNLTKHVKGYDDKMDKHISIIDVIHDFLCNITFDVVVKPTIPVIEPPHERMPTVYRTYNYQHFRPGNSNYIVMKQRKYFPALFDTCYGLIPGEAHNDGQYGYFPYNTEAIKVEDPTLIHMLDPKLYSLSPRNGKKPEGLKAQGWQNDNHGHDYSIVMIHVDGQDYNDSGLLCGKYSDAEKRAYYCLDGREIREDDVTKVQFVYPTPINEKDDVDDFDYSTIPESDFSYAIPRTPTPRDAKDQKCIA